MNELNEIERRMLASGLSAFDEATRRRRHRRIAGRAVAAIALAAAAGLVTARALRAPAPALPPYVEIIADDRQLAAELTLANACERFERNDLRLVVVECTHPGPKSRW